MLNTAANAPTTKLNPALLFTIVEDQFADEVEEIEVEEDVEEIETEEEA